MFRGHDTQVHRLLEQFRKYVPVDLMSCIGGGVYIFKVVIEEADSARVSARHFVNFLFRIFINMVITTSHRVITSNEYLMSLVYRLSTPNYY